MNTHEDIKNRTVTGQTDRIDKASRAARTHQDYWKARLKQRSYTDRQGKRVVVPEWQVRMFHVGREAWFNLETANQATAAVKARDIFLSLVSVGWDRTLEKYKPGPLVKADVCSVGEFLAQIEIRSHLRPRTTRIYATKLRKLVADITKVEAGMKKKARHAKFDYVHGGRDAWVKLVDGQRLDVLTHDALTAWRNAYASKAGSDPAKRKSAERTAASVLRAGRALFSPEVLAQLKGIKLPPSPFATVKLKDPGPQRYHSDINPEWLLAAADSELRQKHPQQYLALFLCLWAGLRRKEADLLMWAQVDLEEGQIHVRRTRYFEPKTEESQRVIDLPTAAVDVLRRFKEGCISELVLEGAEPNPEADYGYYRCDCTWRELIAWLRAKGVRERNAVHMLRKESGSLVASTHGIEAARQHLGHRDIRTTSAHYVDKKKRIEVILPSATAAGQLRSVQGNAC